MPLLPATFVPVRPVATLQMLRCEVSGSCMYRGLLRWAFARLACPALLT